MATKRQIQHLPPAHEVTSGPYDLRELQAPVLRGLPLSIFINIFESSMGGTIYSMLAEDSNVPQVRRLPRGRGAQAVPPSLAPQTISTFTSRVPRQYLQMVHTQSPHRPPWVHGMQVMHDLVIPEHPQFTADITPVPDTPATGVEKESAQSEGPQPQEPGASLLDVSVEADVLKALDSALASALLPHEAQLANRKQQQGQQQQQVEGGAGKEGLDAGPAEPRAFSGAPTVLDYAAAYRSGGCGRFVCAQRCAGCVVRCRPEGKPARLRAVRVFCVAISYLALLDLNEGKRRSWFTITQQAGPGPETPSSALSPTCRLP